ncbi:MAG: type II toxin-antitoxin system Phd/YefM family antitoxin [Leptolyngbya sp. Prado105]|jgi:prevent-host-death family protein|nr:type II toxin-antitoxin system Phd/YefM family antitoxin [Leptolyngbya sp. Prado105]
MLDTRNIYPLTDFQRNAKDFIAQLQNSQKPIILTVNGKAAVVIQDAAAYQDLLDQLELERSASAIRRSIQEAKEGKDIDAASGLNQLKAKHGIPD